MKTIELLKAIRAEQKDRGLNIEELPILQQTVVQGSTQEQQEDDFEGSFGSAYTLKNPLTPKDEIANVRFVAANRLHFEGERIPVDPGTLDGIEDLSVFETIGGNLQLEGIVSSLEDIKRVAKGIQPRYMLPLAGNQAPIENRPVQAFLNPIFIEGTLIRKIAPQLAFLDLATRTVVPTGEIVWYREKYASHNDPKLRLPQEIDEGAELPFITVSDPVKKHISTGKYGFSIRFTDAAIRNDVTAFNEVARKMDNMAYAMSYQWNTLYANELANNFDTTYNGNLPADDQVLEYTPTNPWDNASGDPLDDILQGQLLMETQDEFFYTPTELWVNPNSYLALYQFLYNQDHDWALNPLGSPTQSTQININGIAVRKVPPQSGIPDGKAVLMARGPGVPALLETFDERDARFSTSGNVHVQRVFEENTLNVRFNMWRKFCVISRNPKGILVYHDLET